MCIRDRNELTGMDTTPTSEPTELMRKPTNDGMVVSLPPRPAHSQGELHPESWRLEHLDRAKLQSRLKLCREPVVLVGREVCREEFVRLAESGVAWAVHPADVLVERRRHFGAPVAVG
eukprot:TRINITY_DN5826_c0_g1_i2.p1 TRINITY_DN5826_c0_g1~~TRINITY_DN5826_c0_g1_i2.p1  ORF type:complete len:118 (+),score=5.34 TRINITY_DN5826_c0_g1_i2:121-474(+)